MSRNSPICNLVGLNTDFRKGYGIFNSYFLFRVGSIITDFQSRIKSLFNLKPCVHSETVFNLPHNARASLTIIDNIISYMKKVDARTI